MEYVPIYVPAAHHRATLLYVASLIAPATSSTGEWPEELLERLWSDSAESTNALLIAMARRAGEWVTVSELASVLGPNANFRSVGGALGPVTKRMKAYGRDSWPFEVKQDPNTGRYSYRMSERTAATLLNRHEMTEQVIAEIERRGVTLS